MSRPVPFTNGLPILCDLGEARIDKDMHNGDIMPDIYRAPEVILGMNWATKVDIWAVGVMVGTRSVRKALASCIIQTSDAF